MLFFSLYLLLFTISVIHNFDYSRLQLLENEKSALKDSIVFIYENLVLIDNKIDNMSDYYSKLQLVADLDENRDIVKLGTGGRVYHNDKLSFLSSDDRFLLESTEKKTDIVKNKLNYQLYRADKIKKKMSAKIDKIKYTPSIWPTYGRISAGFGIRIHPITHKPEFHKGVDIANRVGTPIVSTAYGKVVFAGWISGYGKFIKIKHGYGYMTCYGHLSKMNVHEGQIVKKGQLIGYMGSTGLSTGSHLHYEVRMNNKQIDPIPFMMDDYRSY